LSRVGQSLLAARRRRFKPFIWPKPNLSFGRRLGRLVKTPKLHLCDTGLAAALLGFDAASLWADRAAFGQLLETFVF
jgi:hypothetical protein